MGGEISVFKTGADYDGPQCSSNSMTTMLNFTVYPVRAVAVAVFFALSLFPAIAETEEHEEDTATLEVVVFDAEREEPVHGASVRSAKWDGELFTDEAGEVRIPELQPGSVDVTVEYPGYETAKETLSLRGGEVAVYRFLLLEAATQTGTVEVTTTAARVGSGDVYRPTTIMEGEQLQRNLGSSVPATLASVPGFDVQYNGPGAANPTMRGLPGDRVLMLEEGHRTGDIYWTASDHGVMVEPLTAERMEVVRGPAGLLYGSNALGGVVNVVRDDIPSYQPEHPEGQLRTTFDSVNRGLAGGGSVRAPAGPLTLYGELSGRRTGDSRTPVGVLEQTDMQTVNAAAGASWEPQWGRVGGAVRFYDNVYGVPGEFDGELIPGGHPGGVHIEATRFGGRLDTLYDQPAEPFESLQLKAQATRYIHDEIEALVGGEEIMGARFDQTTTDTRFVARHRPIGDPDGVHSQGAAGLSLYTRDMAAGGASPGTRSGRERDVGVFGFEELELEPVRFQAGLRYDFRWVTADDQSPLQTSTEERRITKEVRPRSFHGLSGSIAGLWDFVSEWTVGTSLARSFRNPTIEELYSDGPHLADFSYDIGTPELQAETGLGADLFLRNRGEDRDLEVGVYYNRIDNYIYYNPTGETVRVHREGTRPRSTPVFEAQNDDAVFMGVEGQVEQTIYDPLVLSADVTYTRATRREAGDPLPFIPPLSGGLEARWDGTPWFGSLGVKLAAPQHRVPQPIEVGDRTERPQEPTAGYAYANAMVGWTHFSTRLGHTAMLRVENISNRPWHDHLSRIKQIAPQPGRNIQLSYELVF